MTDGNPLDATIDKAANEMIRRVQDFPEASQPVGGTRLSPDQQLEIYMAIRDNPEALVQVIQEQGEKEAVRYVQAMEKLAMARQEEYDASTRGVQHPGPVQTDGVGPLGGSVPPGSAGV